MAMVGRYFSTNVGATMAAAWPTGEGRPAVDEISVERIQHLGGIFRASKAFLSAVELSVFTELAAGDLDADTLAGRVGIHPSVARDFFDSLVALGLLERESGRYHNPPDVDMFLDRSKPSYVGGMAEMQSAHGYHLWGSLTEALRTGAPQTEAKGDFRLLYRDPDRMRRYFRAMSAGSLMAARQIACDFPWDRYDTFADIGTAQGCLPVQVAHAHPHLSGVGFDFPPAAPLFAEHVAHYGLCNRLRFCAGDFLVDPLPRADVLVMGNILCDLDLAGKQLLLAKAVEALPEGGALIVYDSIIDDDRRTNAAALLTSVAMVLQRQGAFGYTGAECREWMEQAGFAETSMQPLDGPRSAVIGFV